MGLFNACPRVGFCDTKFNVVNSVVVFRFAIAKYDILATAVFQQSIFIRFKGGCFKRFLNINPERIQIYSDLWKCRFDLQSIAATVTAITQCRFCYRSIEILCCRNIYFHFFASPNLSFHPLYPILWILSWKKCGHLSCVR